MITGVQISSSEVVISRGGGKKGRPLTFSKDQTVRATVAQQISPGKIKLLVNGKIVTAKTAMQLVPGEEILLKVVREKDATVLKLVGPAQKITARQVSLLISFFSKGQALADLDKAGLKPVHDMLSQTALKSGQADDDWLPRLIEKGGMSLEKKMAALVSTAKSSDQIKTALDGFLQQDLKAGLLKSLAAGPDGAGAGKAVSSLAETLEQFQVLNQHQAGSGRLLLPFPIFSDTGFRFGQLLIQQDGKSKEDPAASDRMVKVSFLLDMTRLGALRADFSILRQEIAGRFLLSDEDTCQYLKALIPELKSQLAGREYQVRNIDCSVAATEEVQPSSLIEALVKEGDDRVLNIVV